MTFNECVRDIDKLFEAVDKGEISLESAKLVATATIGALLSTQLEKVSRILEQSALGGK